jgi:chromosome segregation ATPase
MIKGRLLLSLIAFVVSFSISLLIGRDFGKAMLGGTITLFAALVGSSVAEGRYRFTLSRRAEDLKANIRALKRRRADTYDALVLMTQERDRIANSLNSLQSQLRNLQVQSANLWQQKEELSWNITAPAAKAEKTIDQSQVHGLRLRIEELTLKEAELNKSFSATLAAKQRAEQALTTNQAELNQIQAEIVEKTRTKDELAKELSTLILEKQKLEAELTVLQPKVKELERYRAELNQFLDVAEPKRRQVESSSRSLQDSIAQLQGQITALQSELGQLETQIVDRRTQKEILDQELATLRDEKTKELEGDLTEWQRFFGQLQEPELKALVAISKQPNPSPALKLIAETHLTMPELLIDSINERAMDTIGDLVIDPSSASPIVAPEYRDTVQNWLQEFA